MFKIFVTYHTTGVEAKVLARVSEWSFYLNVGYGLKNTEKLTHIYDALHIKLIYKYKNYKNLIMKHFCYCCNICQVAGLWQLVGRVASTAATELSFLASNCWNELLHAATRSYDLQQQMSQTATIC